MVGVLNQTLNAAKNMITFINFDQTAQAILREMPGTIELNFNSSRLPR